MTGWIALALIVAPFALSHARWLVNYTLAGWAGAGLGLHLASLLLAGIAVITILMALHLWPREVGALAHDHPDLEPDSPHLAEHGHGVHHRHAVVIDDLHPRWPRPR